MSIIVNGAIDASGGDGGVLNDRVGGGGSGGAIRLVAPSIGGAGVLLAAGGVGLDTRNSGGLGRIRLEANRFSGLTNIVGVFRSGGLAPNTPLLSTAAPLLQIVQIAGFLAPTRPTGSFSSVDVTIDEPTTTTIQVDGSNIPSGTNVEITIWNETDGFQSITSALAGTFASSTTTANVTFSPGFSRIFTRATWVP